MKHTARYTHSQERPSNIQTVVALSYELDPIVEVGKALTVPFVLKSTVGSSAMWILRLPNGLNVTSTTGPVQFLVPLIGRGTGAGTPLYKGHSIWQARAVMKFGGPPGVQSGLGRLLSALLLSELE